LLVEVFAVKRSRRDPLAAKRHPAVRKRRSQETPARLSRGSKGLVLAAQNFAAKVGEFEVTDHASADLAGRWRQEIDAQERKILAWFAPAKQAAFRAHATICKQENEALAPYREARRMVNAKLAAWRRAQGPLVNSAEGAWRDDFPAESEAQPAITERLRQVFGVSFRDNWRVEVTDKLALVKAIAARPELVNLVDPNMNALNHLARAHKDTLEIPGIHIWCEVSVAASPRS
jgi:hypothetical protein